MPGVVRLGDLNNAMAPVVAAVANTVFTNGRPTAVLGSVIAPHPIGHFVSVIVEGASTVFAEGRPVAFQGALESCLDFQLQSSFDVYVPGF